MNLRLFWVMATLDDKKEVRAIARSDPLSPHGLMHRSLRGLFVLSFAMPLMAW